MIGAPKAIRAVANSCSRSWFAFAIPCHRVLHKGGASPGNRRDGRQYRWVDYEGKLDAKRSKRSDYRKLLRGYVDSFRILGRSRICRLDFDAEPMFREVARWHGEKSEPAAVARLAYTAGAENLMLDRELEPAPPAPMPCDVMIYMRGMRLPELPASLVLRDDRPVR